MGRNAGSIESRGANAKEIRAVTPTYTFSMKRPKGGWGVSVKDFSAAYDKIYKSVYNELQSYVDRQRYGAAAADRAQATHFHKVMTKLANKYGRIYTKKKG